MFNKALERVIMRYVDNHRREEIDINDYFYLYIY